MMISKMYESVVKAGRTAGFLLGMTMLFVSAAVSGAEFRFADNGKAECVIVLPDRPKGFEQDAAKDLQHFLSRMTGADFKVMPESKVPAEGSAIYVGQTEYAGKQDIHFDKLTPEEWVIRPVGKNLILSGGHPIGSFYAVWNLLNQFGCY